jgi:hypothetical protein
LRYRRVIGSGIVTADWKYLRGKTRPFGRGVMLFSRTADPGDQHNLRRTELDRRSELESLLRARLGELIVRAPERSAGDEDTATLRALGYL